MTKIFFSNLWNVYNNIDVIKLPFQNSFIYFSKVCYVSCLYCTISSSVFGQTKDFKSTHVLLEVMAPRPQQLMAKVFQERGSLVRYSGFPSWKVSQENYMYVYSPMAETVEVTTQVSLISLHQFLRHIFISRV